MEYYNNILCITGSELIIRRDACGNIISGIIERWNYHKLKQRKQITVHGYGGNGREIYIEYDTILSNKLKKKIIEKFGDPRKNAKIKPFGEHIKADNSAIAYFNNYTKENGDKLTDKQKIEYCNDASLLNAMGILYDKYIAARRNRGASIRKFWPKAQQILNEYLEDYEKACGQKYPNTLPNSPKRLRMKYEAYKKEGYAALISKKLCNTNSEKISDEAKLWILAKWSSRIDIVTGERQMLRLYNSEAEKRGWKKVKNVSTIYNFLYREDIKELWWSHRYGELKAKEKFAYQHSTLLPTMRDSLWYSDGTRLNYFYLDEKGEISTCKVYEVMDVYSEVLLGYCISKEEDYSAQYRAYKMAMQTSGYKPYEIRYDNQGGHKKLETGNFLKKLAHLTIKTMPYNGKSKTIESVFGRFQQEFLKKDWFFTGQNITATKKESKANKEFILANKDKLPTLDEIKKIYAQRREEWNAAQHPKTGKSRIATYNESQNEQAARLNIWDMVDMFWITREKQVTCTASGISFVEKGEKYEYVVYNEQRIPDIAWLRKNIDKKFTIKYDPDDMSLIYLYEKTYDGLRFVAAAETKVLVHRGKQEQEAWEAEYFKKIEAENKRLRIEARNKMDAILEMHNLLPEQHGLNSPHLKGIENRHRKQAKKADIAAAQKVESDIVVIDDEGFDEKELLKLY
jgi:hypothetical protein